MQLQTAIRCLSSTNQMLSSMCNAATNEGKLESVLEVSLA